jgi:hypothetical protein
MPIYSVHNTSHRSLTVVAQNSEAALSFAWAAGHIRHTDNGLTSEGRSVHEVRSSTGYGPLSDHWQTIQQAASQGYEGVVELDEGRISVGNKVVPL